MPQQTSYKQTNLSANMASALLTAMGLPGLAVATHGHYQSGRTRRTRIWALGSVVLVLGLLLWGVGCSSSSSNHTNPPGAQTVMVVGTSGAITHSVPISLTIQ